MFLACVLMSRNKQISVKLQSVIFLKNLDVKLGMEPEHNNYIITVTPTMKLSQIFMKHEGLGNILKTLNLSLINSLFMCFTCIEIYWWTWSVVLIWRLTALGETLLQIVESNCNTLVCLFRKSLCCIVHCKETQSSSFMR